MRLAFSGSCFLIAMTAAVARAESPPPPACVRAPEVKPAAGAHVPANIPAFLFQQTDYPLHQPRPIAWYAIELREAGGTLVPFRVETFTQNFLTYAAILPDRAIKPGTLVVSFLDDCPANPYLSTQPVDPPVRNDRFTYQVTEASPLPTRLGTAMVRKVDYSMPRGCTDDTAAWVEIEVTPTPEALAFREVITISAATGDMLELWGPAAAGTYFDAQKGVFVFKQRAGCGPPKRYGRLGSGHSEVVYTAQLFKGPSIEPARAAVDVDCSGVPDADVCALDAAAAPDAAAIPDGAATPPVSSGDLRAADTIVPDAAAMPDAAAAIVDAATLSDSGATPAPSGEGCDCRVGSSPRRSAGGFVLLFLTALLLRRGSRLSASRSRPRPRRP